MLSLWIVLLTICKLTASSLTSIHRTELWRTYIRTWKYVYPCAYSATTLGKKKKIKFKYLKTGRGETGYFKMC